GRTFMPTHIALLRAINVGGRNSVAMSDLRGLLEELGFEGVTSLLQSGNLVFRAKQKSGEALERLLEKESAARLGMSADFLVRSAAEWAKIVDRNPFPKEAKADPGHLVVMCLKAAPQATSVKELQASIQGRETIRHDGKQLYITYP